MSVACSAHFLSPQPLLSLLTSFVNSYQPLLSTSPLLSTFVKSEVTSFVNNINHLCRYIRGHYFCQQGPTRYVTRNFIILSMSAMLSHTPQTGLSLRKASLKVSIAYHRGVKTTNASANLSLPRTIHIFHKEYENHKYHAGQMKARPYSKSTKRMAITLPVRSSWRP